MDSFLDKFNQAISELPDNWDGLHLGGYSPDGVNRDFSKSLFRTLKCYGGYGYAVRGKAIPKIISELNKENLQVDTCIAHMMHDLNWYKTKEMLVEHPEGYSFIQDKFVNYRQLYTNISKERLKLY